jgi:hypothetical protein
MEEERERINKRKRDSAGRNVGKKIKARQNEDLRKYTVRNRRRTKGRHKKIGKKEKI